MAVTDDFNRANGGLGANWTTDPGYSALAIVSNTCKGSTGGAHNVAVYSAGGTVAADQYAQCKVITSGGFIGLVLRSNGAGVYYTCFYSAGSATIYRVSGGSFANIAVGSTITPAANDLIYFEIVGSALTMKVNGVTVATATDGTYSGAGYTGFDIFDNLAAVDDFEAGAVGAVSVNLTGVSASPAIGVPSFNVSLPLGSVAAAPTIGTGTVTIGGVVTEPPPVEPGGGTGAGRPARTGMRLRPTEDKAVYLKGVSANPRVGQVMVLHEMRQAYEEYAAPMRRAEARKPAEMPPGLRELFKPVEKPIPPALFVYQVGLPKLKSAVGTGTVKAFYEDIDEETIAMLDLL